MDQFKLLQNGMLIGPQPSEDRLRQAKQEGIKTSSISGCRAKPPRPTQKWSPAAAWTT